MIVFFELEKINVFAIGWLFCSLFESLIYSVKYVTAFISVHESYEFPEALKHNKRRAIQRFVNVPSVGLLNHFTEQICPQRKHEEYASQQGKEILHQQTSLLCSLLDSVFAPAIIHTKPSFVTFHL